MKCANTYYLNRYLAEQEAGEREQERLDAIAEEIKEDILTQPDQLAYALVEVLSYDSDDSLEFFKAIAELTSAKSQSNFNSAAASISDIVNKHLDKHCRYKAELQHEKEAPYDPYEDSFE